MDERKLNGALFAQMCAEQQDYRAWLMTLPPDEILDHAAEFAVREDILVELEAFDLPADQAALSNLLFGFHGFHQDSQSSRPGFAHRSDPAGLLNYS